MKKIDIAVAIFFVAVITAFLVTSLSGAAKRHEPTSKAEIETHVAHTTAAPKAEIKTESFAVLTETVIEDVQAVPEPEPEEVIAEPGIEPENAATASEAEEPESEPIPEDDYVEPQDDYVEQAEEPEMEFFATCTITGYCNCYQCCGSYSGGPTASGSYPSDGWTCASNSLPLGTMIYVDGYGIRYVEDRGDSIMDGTWIDLFYGDHDSAQSVGLQYRDVYIVR